VRIAVYSDLHCGHINAIAPTLHQVSEDSHGCWKLFKKFNRKYGPFDAVLILGDVIDGKAGRNGGVELVTTDQSKQADIAIQVLDQVPVKKGAKWYQVGGTPYHGGMSEDFERLVASSFGAEYGAVVWPEIGGVRFRMRHKINRAMNNLNKQIGIHQRRLGSGREKQADCMLFGHLHTYAQRQEACNGKPMYAISCPALQGVTDFGSRQCDGDVDIGCLAIDVEKGSIASIHEHITPLGVDTWGTAKSLGLL